MENECTDDILRMRGIYLNVIIFRMSDDTFSLNMVHMIARST